MHTAWTLIAQMAPALAAGQLVPADTAPVAAVVAVAAPAPAPAPLVGRPAVNWSTLAGPDTARTRSRAKAMEYSGFYRARLSVHRALSYTMIPLFIGSYVTGDQILRHRADPPKWATDLHKPFAIATESVFAVNTITGLWNLYASRHNDVGKTKRTLHSLLFIAAGAGFTYAGTSLASDAKNRTDPTRFHRTVAVASMGVSLVGWGMMILVK